MRIQSTWWRAVVTILAFCQMAAYSQPQSKTSLSSSARDLPDLKGEYITGTGFYGTQLQLLPNHAFTFQSGSDIAHAPNPHNKGSYHVQNGSLFLMPQLPVTSTEEWNRLPLHLLPVLWGKRTYLLSTEHKSLLAFCNAVNTGNEPRHQINGRFYLKSGDENKGISGLPPLPSEWHAYLLTAPIQATLVSVLNSKRGVINAGRSQGIQAGMLVWSQKTGRHGYSYVVMEVQSTTATVINVQGDPFGPKFVGQKVSTFDPQHR